MKDLIGQALLDFFYGKYSEDIITETNITNPDIMPLPYLFRDYFGMPPIEQKALDLCAGTILDIGCGAGNHSLYLQDKNYTVSAIDISEGAVKVCKLRTIQNARQLNILSLKNEQFDTILLLMNGTGIFQTLNKTEKYLNHLKLLLSSKGQILIDSCDIMYMYDTDKNGTPIITNEMPYFGEVEFTMSYKGNKCAPFNWLYLDEDNFKIRCDKTNLHFEIIMRGGDHNYLARITK